MLDTLTSTLAAAIIYLYFLLIDTLYVNVYHKHVQLCAAHAGRLFAISSSLSPFVRSFVSWEVSRTYSRAGRRDMQNSSCSPSNTYIERLWESEDTAQITAPNLQEQDDNQETTAPYRTMVIYLYSASSGRTAVHSRIWG